MIKINKKISFIIFVLSLFFIGINFANVLDEGFSSGYKLFRQISSFGIFIAPAIYFYIYTYRNKDKEVK